MSEPLCYFMAEACRRGHIASCPMANGRDPWAEQTEEKPASPPARWVKDYLEQSPDGPTWHREYLGNFSLGEE